MIETKQIPYCEDCKQYTIAIKTTEIKGKKYIKYQCTNCNKSIITKIQLNK